MTLRKALTGARAIMVDNARLLTLAWFGGHGIHAYADDGTECSFWNTGSFATNDCTEDQARASMTRHIEEGYYP